MTSITRSKRWLTAGAALLVVGGVLALAAVPSQAACPNGAKTCTCPVGSNSCHCPPGFPRTQDYCEFCNPGSQYDPKTKTCVAVEAAHFCRNPRSGKLIKYHGSRKPLLCFPPPRAVTNGPLHVKRHSAHIAGLVLDPHHFKTHWYFLWGACSRLNHRTKGGVVHRRTHVSAILYRLHPGTVYCYRLVAFNRRGRAVGRIMRFRTHISRRPRRPHGFTG